ncbi:MAG: CoA ester lyase [Balneolaceae bacterium]|nr:CoA ester lyase [Balneolaceae bacterium]
MEEQLNIQKLAAVRSLLFVPAGKLDKWGKAEASGADVLCIDLEDSVPPDEKLEARSEVFAFLEHGTQNHPLVILRINSIETDFGKSDLEMIRELSNPVGGLMVPKLTEAGSLEKLSKQLIMFERKTQLIPLIETAQALENCRAIMSTNLVTGAIFGGHDLAMELGCSKDWDVLSAYRSEFIRSAGGLNLSLIDMPWFGLDDIEGLRTETKNAKRFGFTAKAAIHPAQAEPINRVFMPTRKEADDAAEMIKVFEKAGGHAVAWRGTVLEPPVINQAKRVLERANYFEQKR